MRHPVFLAWRAMMWHRGQTATVVLCLALTLWFPVTVRLVLQQFQSEIAERAAITPLVIGAQGSRIDLILHALYFRTMPPSQTTMAEVEYIDGTGFGEAIPLYVEFETQGKDGVAGVPIVGTSPEYFEFRALTIKEGTLPLLLGDCIVGASVAERMNLRTGDSILSAPKNAFDIAGDYPLRMRISGILRAAHSPDDEVIFTDTRTTWVIAGIGHGHQSLDQTGADPRLLLDSNDRSVTASAAVLPYTEITEANIDSFHFHGQPETFPLTAVIAVPDSERSRIMLLGRYAAARETAQCLKPPEVIGELMGIVFRVEQLVWVSSFLSAIVTLLMLGLVLFLSMRLRASEMRTMFCLGCSRGTIVKIVSCELAILLITATTLAAACALATSAVIADLLRQMLF